MSLNETGGLGIGGRGGGVAKSERKIKATESAAERVEALPSAFAERAEREQERFVDAVDSEYWIAICFETREKKEEFLRKLGLLEHGDKYLLGDFVAKKLGITLDSRGAKFGKERALSPRLRGLVE